MAELSGFTKVPPQPGDTAPIHRPGQGVDDTYSVDVGVIETPDEVIARHGPARWFDSDLGNLVVDQATSEVTTLTDRGSLATDLAAAGGQGYFQAGSADSPQQSRIRLYESRLFGAGDIGATKTVFHVAQSDGHRATRQSFFYSAPLLLEWYSNAEFRIWFYRTTGGFTHTSVRGGHPEPGVPFLFSGYCDGVDYAGTIGRGKPVAVTTTASGISSVPVLGDGATAGRNAEGGFFCHLEFDRVLTDAEWLAVQDALARKYQLWEHSRLRPRAGGILGHRCAVDDNAAENSVASAQAAVKWGVDGVEVDVWTSLDGTPYIHHDGVFNGDHTDQGVTNGVAGAPITGNLSAYGDTDLDQVLLKFADGTISAEPLPKLEDFLVAMKPYGLRIMLDIKDGGAWVAVRAAVTAAGYPSDKLLFMLPVSNRANWIDEFPEAYHFGKNYDGTWIQPYDYKSARRMAELCQDEDLPGAGDGWLSGYILEYTGIKHYHLQVARETGLQWFIHWQGGNPQCRENGAWGYVDYAKGLHGDLN